MSITQHERTEQQKKIDELVLERVKRGVEWLEEKHGPDWVDHIDLKTLDLANGDACILGQVFSGKASLRDWDGYGYARRTFFIPEGKDDADYGFDDNDGDYDSLQAAWEYVLIPLVKNG